MARRFRWRRVAKWIGMTLTGWMLLAWALSARFCGITEITSPTFCKLAGLIVTALPQPPNSSSNRWTGHCGFDGGTVWIGVWEGGYRFVGPSIQRQEWFEIGLEWPRKEVSMGRMWFNQMIRIIIPLWIPFLMCAASTALLFYRDHRRIPPGHCPTCGYNLTGNTSGKCPECGERPPKPV